MKYLYRPIRNIQKMLLLPQYTFPSFLVQFKFYCFAVYGDNEYPKVTSKFQLFNFENNI